MYDETFDRTYQAGRASLNESLDRTFARLRSGAATTFRRLHAIQFAAPWHKRSKTPGCA